MKESNYINNLDDIKLTKEFVFLNPYKFIVFFIYLIIFLLLIACGILSVTKKQETVDVSGAISLSSKVQDIQVLVDGIVDEVYVKEGEYVEKGNNIFSLRSDKLSLQKSELSKKLEKAKEQQEYLTKLVENINNKTNTFKNDEKEGYFYAQVEKYLSQINALENGVSSTEVNILTSQKSSLNELLDAIKNNKSLSSSHSYYTQLELYKTKLNDYTTKITSLEDVIKTESNPLIVTQYQKQLDTLRAEKDSFTKQNTLEVQQQINSLDSKIEQAQSVVSINRKKAEVEIENLKKSSLVEIEDKKQQLQNTIKECEASLESTDVDLNNYIVKATESGYVNYKGEIKKDIVLSGGSVVGMISSAKNEDGKFEVILNIPSSGIGFINVNQNVKITVDGLDRKDYGFINGKIEKIYESPVQIDKNIYYQAKASIDINEKDSIYKNLFTLKDNMSVQANIITKETSWLVYLLEKMNIFKDSKKL